MARHEVLARDESNRVVSTLMAALLRTADYPHDKFGHRLRSCPFMPSGQLSEGSTRSFSAHNRR